MVYFGKLKGKEKSNDGIKRNYTSHDYPNA